MVEVGNIHYFLWLAFLFACLFISLYLCKTFGKEFSRKYIEAILWINLAGHLLKQFFPYIMAEWPASISKSTPDNLCALYVLIAPFCFRFGNKYVKDYLFYMGVLSGLLAYLFPTSPVSEATHNMEYWWLETLRYYLCHMPIFVCGWLIALTGVHELDYKRIKWMPLFFFGAEAIIYLDALIIVALGWEGGDQVHDFASYWAYMLDRGAYSNGSAIVGPPAWMDGFLGWAYGLMPPYLMVYYSDGSIHFLEAYNAETMGEVIRFTPFIYLVIPIYVARFTVLPLMAYPFEKRHMKIDRLLRKQKRQMKRALKPEKGTSI